MPDGYIQIYENTHIRNISDLEKKYILIWENGTNIMNIFKRFYLQRRDAHFYVKNIEYFVGRFREFRDLEFIAVEGKEMTSAEKIDEMKRKYAALMKKMKCKDIEESVEVAFSPRIYDSIRTSLREPRVYLSAERNCHKIYRILMEGPADLKKIKEILNDEQADDDLKSMLYSGIVKRRQDEFYLNSLIL
ncbi:hypothetical protein ENBRE01_0703 [Enteropsectra breve]|nr:hypothetical protein ENBRE01_0703 [Enteropsectra breve]